MLTCERVGNGEILPLKSGARRGEKEAARRKIPAGATPTIAVGTPVARCLRPGS